MIILGWAEFAEKVQGLVDQGLRFISEGLGVTLQEMAVQLVATIVLFIAVRLLLWNKVTEILDQRKKAVTDALKTRDDALEESKKLQEEGQAMIVEASAESKRIIEKAKAKGYEQAEEIVKNAEETAKLKIQNAEAEIEMKVAESKKEIKEEIVDVAYAMASSIVGKEIEKGSYDLKVEDYLNKVDANE